jgi:large subunit ribosomal protein L32
MGAQPKIKISKSRRDRRRSHDALKNPPMSNCPKCGKSRRPHFVCSYCGHYGAKPKLVKESKSKSIN